MTRDRDADCVPHRAVSGPKETTKRNDHDPPHAVPQGQSTNTDAYQGGRYLIGANNLDSIFRIKLIGLDFPSQSPSCTSFLPFVLTSA
jgi:hypothetical protein